jgi:phospholipid/cholesterol/gamma-HCH transport system substrate-binding protein
MTPNRERVWVGLFVVISVAVLSGTAVAVWGGVGRSGVSHHAYFKFAGGVQPGTAVRYGGLRVGTVQRVRIDPGDSTRIEVDLVVDPGTPLKADSVAKLSSLSPLSDYYIEISTGTERAALAPPGGVLNSAESVGIAQMGDTIQTLVPQIQNALDKMALNLDSLQTTLGRANDLLNDSNRSNIGQALARANDLLNDRNRSSLSESLNNFSALLSESRPKVSSGLTNMNDATSRLVPLLEDVKRTSARADQMLSNLDSTLTENRPDLRVSVSELREVLANSKTTMDQLQGIISQNAVNIDEILENMRFSAENIRSLTQTIKSSPASLIRGVKVKDRKPGGGIQK